ncbi:MAG: amidohydrolase, partial [Chloroflexi bacterium]
VFFAEGRAQIEVARMVNDAYADLIAKRPGRFLGFASIPMDDPDGALRELARVLDELRLQGVVLLSNIRGRALADPAYRPFFAECDRRKACVFVHPMIPAAAEPFGEYVLGPIVGFPFDTTLAVARLCYAGVFKELPNIRWLIAHAGGAIPYLLERLDSGWRDFAECRANIDEPPSTYLKRLYYDTVTFSPNNLRLLRDVVGTDHLAMGSDYPHLLGSIDKAISSIEGLDWDATEKERVFSGTALALLANLPARLAHVV